MVLDDLIIKCIKIIADKFWDLRIFYPLSENSKWSNISSDNFGRCYNVLIYFNVKFFFFSLRYSLVKQYKHQLENKNGHYFFIMLFHFIS
jgi:hypothetical protein